MCEKPLRPMGGYFRVFLGPLFKTSRENLRVISSQKMLGTLKTAKTQKEVWAKTRLRIWYGRGNFGPKWPKMTIFSLFDTFSKTSKSDKKWGFLKSQKTIKKWSKKGYFRKNEVFTRSESTSKKGQKWPFFTKIPKNETFRDTKRVWKWPSPWKWPFFREFSHPHRRSWVFYKITCLPLHP